MKKTEKQRPTEHEARSVQWGRLKTFKIGGYSNGFGANFFKQLRVRSGVINRGKINLSHQMLIVSTIFRDDEQTCRT